MTLVYQGYIQNPGRGHLGGGGYMRWRAVWVSLLFVRGLSYEAGLEGQAVRYPDSPRGDVVEEIHGTRVADPYRWLEQLDSRRTTEWVKTQAEFTQEFLRRIPRREPIRERLTALWDYSRTEVPWREAGRVFFVENTGLQPQPVLYMQKNPGDRPRVVLDPNRISPDGSVEVEDFELSPDGRRLAYRTAAGGGGAGRVHVRDLSDGRDLRDTVDDTLTSACWTRDARGFFYVRRSPLERGQPADSARLGKQLLYHVLGQYPESDRLIREWKDARWVYCMRSEDGRYEIAVAEKGMENEVFVVDLGDPLHPHLNAPWVRLLGDRSALLTPINAIGSKLYLFTNLDAPRRRVIALDLGEGAAARPQTIIPESPEVVRDAAIAGDRLVVHYLGDVKSRLQLFDLEGRPAGEVTLPGVGAVGWPVTGRPWVPELFYSFTSFLAPSTVFRCDLRTGASTPFRPPRVPFGPAAYETRQVFYPSKDGVRVPMFVTASKNLKRDGNNPTLLTGYGGYGSVRQPSYEPDIPFWLERGGIYAVANLRGGGEYGEDWHRAGMLEHKQNSFDDFAAAAEYLIRERYTSAGKLAIYGHSNGGLLVGASVTQRPDLFAAAVANAGHYDMLRYHKFTVGSGWIPEYGSPDDPAAFRYLRAYSPLHNVRPTACYPAVLLLAADHDDTVVPSHAYKFAAALQAAQSCDRPVLLRVALDSSHGYQSRQSQIAERTDLWTFLTSQLHVTPPTSPIPAKK